MLASILNPENCRDPKEMVLQKLECAFTKLYGTRKKEKKTFYEIAGMAMKKFLQKHSSLFDVRMDKRKGVCYVSHIAFNHECENLFVPSSLPIYGNSNQGKTSSLSVCSSEKQDDILSVGSLDTESDWTLVTHKRQNQKVILPSERRRLDTLSSQPSNITKSCFKSYASVLKGKHQDVNLPKHFYFEKAKVIRELK